MPLPLFVKYFNQLALSLAPRAHIGTEPKNRSFIETSRNTARYKQNDLSIELRPHNTPFTATLADS